MKHIYIFGAIAAMVILAACKKNEFRRDEYTTPTGKAFVKIAYFSADSIAKSVQIYVNNELVSNTISNHTPFPGGGFNTLGASSNGYLAVDPSKGSASIRFVTANPGSTIISSELFTLSAPVTANIQQVIFISDTAAKTNAFTVNTQTERPDSGFVKMQFVNCMPNSGPIKFYYKDSLVAENIKYKEVVDFKTLPLYVTSLSIYPNDSIPRATSLIATYSFTAIGNQKVYTALARGYVGLKDAQRIPKVSLVIVK